MSLLVYEEETIEELGNAVRQVTGISEQATVNEMTEALMASLTTGTGGGAYSKSLVYTDNADGTTCALSGIGECKDATLIIPAIIGGRVVTSISDNAFEGNTQIKELYVPNTVLSIGTKAFKECTNLKRAILPIKLNSLGGSAFDNCTSLEELELPIYLTRIPSYAFYRNNLKFIRLPSNLESIGEEAFCRQTRFTCKSFTIPETLTLIEYNAFYNWYADDMFYPKNYPIPTIYNDYSRFLGGKGRFEGPITYTGYDLPQNIKGHCFQYDTELFSNYYNEIPLFGTGEYLISGDFQLVEFWSDVLYNSIEHPSERYLLTVATSFSSGDYTVTLIDDITKEVLYKGTMEGRANFYLQIGDQCNEPTARVIKRGYHDN